MRWLPSIFVLALACDQATPHTDVDPGTDGPLCVPLEVAFTRNAKPFIESHCAACHGETPDFGAPFSLLNYDELVAGEEGERIVDRMVRSLIDGDMPPATAPQLDHDGLDTLVGWASCGLEHPDWSDGLEANREIYASPDEPPADATAISITAPEQKISPTTLDDYRQFSFTNLVTEDVFIRRFEAILDESRVVHHLTLQRNGNYYYAWAPGTTPVQFPDGGLRLRPRDTLVLEIHYNNGAGVPDVIDSSGIRLWVSPPADTEWGLLSPNTFDIAVPPQSVGTATHTCKATQDFDVLAAMPHMHEVGSAFDHIVHRNDGSEESLISLTGWSFEAQYFYDVPVSVSKGEELEMTCTYDNKTNGAVRGGLRTSDEMCFDFLYVKPVSAGCR